MSTSKLLYLLLLLLELEHQFHLHLLIFFNYLSAQEQLLLECRHFY